jgi:hypothetical protein
MKLCGIDYSYSSPAISIMEYCPDKPFELDSVRVLSICKKNDKIVSRDNLVVDDLNDYDFVCDIDKFVFLADSTTEFINKKSDEDIHVAIEDFSFGSGGRAFTIGENTGILKRELFDNGMRLRTYAPKFIKRFAKEENFDIAVEYSEGKLKKNGEPKIGDLKKPAMHEIFCWKFEIDLCKYYGIERKYKSPLSDIVDSLWILYILWLETKIRNGNIQFLTEHEIDFIKIGVKNEGLDNKSFTF